MRNVFTICGKELRSYFTSPIAYLLMALFGLIFGFFFYSATAYFVVAGLRAQMGGQQGTHRHQAELSQRHLPGPTGQDGE